MTDTTKPHTVAVPKADLQPHAVMGEPSAGSNGSVVTGVFSPPRSVASEAAGARAVPPRAASDDIGLAPVDGPGWIRPVLRAVRNRPVTAGLVALAVGATFWTLSRLKNDPA